MSRKKIARTGPALIVLIALFVVYRWFNPSPRAFLLSSDQLILYSIQPYPDGNSPPERFHRRPVLGKVTITDSAEKERLINTLFGSFSNKEEGLACFSPHHALRAFRRGHVMDLEICFDCQAVDIQKDGHQIVFQPITDKARQAFDTSLKTHNLPVSKGPW